MRRQEWRPDAGEPIRPSSPPVRLAQRDISPCQVLVSEIEINAPVLAGHVVWTRPQIIADSARTECSGGEVFFRSHATGAEQLENGVGTQPGEKLTFRVGPLVFG